MSPMNTTCSKPALRKVPTMPSPPSSTVEFLRLPPPGSRCQVTGLSRASLNALILPSSENGYCPPVKSFSLKRKGSRRGIRLIDFESLSAFIRSHEESPRAEQEVREESQ